jgi:hypothetical protein
MTNEEAFLVVVGVDEPTGDTVGSTRFDFAGLGTEYVHTVDFDFNLPIACIGNLDIGFAEDDEQVARTSIFEVVSRSRRSNTNESHPAKYLETPSPAPVRE